MAQWVKMLSAKTDTFEFNLWDPHGGRRVSAFMGTHFRAPVWRPEGNLWKLALPFHYVDPGDQTLSSGLAACSVTPWATSLVLEMPLNKWTTWNVAPATERFYENIVTIKMLAFNPRTLYRIGKHSTTKRYPQPFRCCTRPNRQQQNPHSFLLCSSMWLSLLATCHSAVAVVVKPEEEEEEEKIEASG